MVPQDNAGTYVPSLEYVHMLCYLPAYIKF